jgi:hypothetical protein
VTDPVFPPVSTTVTPSNVTEVIESVTPVVPPAPLVPNQILSVQSVDDPTSGTPTPEPAPVSGS